VQRCRIFVPSANKNPSLNPSREILDPSKKGLPSH
jgi:hypothetical protein